jgi:hypothetical protein
VYTSVERQGDRGRKEGERNIQKPNTKQGEDERVWVKIIWGRYVLPATLNTIG